MSRQLLAAEQRCTAAFRRFAATYSATHRELWMAARRAYREALRADQSEADSAWKASLGLGDGK
jgi:hypothetical protein